MNQKTTPRTAVAVCTEHWSAVWVDGNFVPAATAFELKCDANSHPRFKLNADIRSLPLHDDFVMDAATAKAVLACVSTNDLIKALAERGR